MLLTTISVTLGGVFALISTNAPSMVPKMRSLSGSSRNPVAPSQLSRAANILVMGIDGVADPRDPSEQLLTGRSDTLLLVRFDPNRDRVSVLSIPRDTRVEIPGRGRRKLNEANPIGGVSLTSQTIARILNSVAIDRYIRFNSNAFSELIDLLGGVEVFVAQPMSYLDKAQQLKIHLQPGWQTLNGEQAQQFARYRDDRNGDIGRIQRQQILLKALRNRLSSPTIVPRLPKIIRVMQKYIDTNLSLEEILVLMNTGLQRSPADLNMVMLPGRFSNPEESENSYWIIDPSGRDRVMREYFESEDSPSGKLESVAAGLSPKKLKIAIQNASGNPLAATQIANSLKKMGFKNIYAIDDWPDPQRQTEIIVQKGDLAGGEAVQNLLNLGRIEASSTGDIDSDLTIRIGEDWMNVRESDSID